MSRSWRSRRAALFAGAAGAAAPAAAQRDPDAVLVGRDFVRPRARGGAAGRARWVPALVACVAAALLLAALRVQVLRVRYELGRAVAEETQLLERQRAATVALGELRDPRRLRRLAEARGFARPERVIEISPSDRTAGRP
jgi:hypothetical protein